MIFFGGRRFPFLEMKGRAVVFISIILCFKCLALCDDASRVVASNAEYDFGIIQYVQIQKRGASILQHTFVIKNSSAFSLKIKGVFTSCGCTLAKIDRNSIEPYSSVDIRASLDVFGISGEKKAVVKVVLGDGSMVDLRLKVFVYVATKVIPAVPVLEFVENKKGSSQFEVYMTRPVVLGRNDLERVGCVSPWEDLGVMLKKMDLSEVIANDSFVQTAKYTFEVTANPHFNGVKFGDFVFRFFDGRELRVPVEFRVFPAVAVVPDKMFCGVVRSGDRLVKYFQVVFRNSSNVVSVKSDDKNIKFDVCSNSKNGLSNIRADIIWNAKPGFYEIHCRVITTDQSYRELPFVISSLVE